MAVCQPPGAQHVPSSLFSAASRKRSHSSLSVSRISWKWIDEEVYRTTVLSLFPAQSESEADEKLQISARDLGLLPTHSASESTIDIVAATLSEVAIASNDPQGSFISQSTAPTSCGSSERRLSTSLSTKSSTLGSRHEAPTIVYEMERKRQSGFKNGLRKMTGFRKKKLSISSASSTVSVQSYSAGTITDVLPSDESIHSTATKHDASYLNPDIPIQNAITLEPVAIIDEEALQRSLDCESLVLIRTTQLEEKTRFLEYQTRLIRDLLLQREKFRTEKRRSHEALVAEQEEKNEKAIEALESHQLEDELKQRHEYEVEKRTMLTRLKYMEAYCHTPSPPQSPSQASFQLRASEDSFRSLPERHVTQQHYENLAQAYHVRDNMDDLHDSKINVLRGKQKRALQNFMLRKEREVEQMEKDHRKELDALDAEYDKKEAEIRQEFELKRTKLEARWKLQALVERTRMERDTGLKYEGLPDVNAMEA